LFNRGQILRIKQLGENIFSLLLELFVDEVLKGLSGDALDLLVCFLLVACRRLLILHFLVFVQIGWERAYLGGYS
jgi:hypothetical protein